MSKSFIAHTHPLAAAALAVTAMLCLASCGSSNSKNAGQTAESRAATRSAEAAIAKVPREKRVAAARVGVVTLSKCLRKYGIKVPAQRVLGLTPAYSTTGIDTSTRQYKQAYHICLPRAIAGYQEYLQEH